MERELSTDAGSLAGSEGFLGMGCPATRVLGQETVGAELLGVLAPHRGVTMDERDEDGRPVLRSHGIAFTDHGVRIRAACEDGGSRPEAQCLLEDTPDVTKFGTCSKVGSKSGSVPRIASVSPRTSASTVGVRNR